MDVSGWTTDQLMRLPDYVTGSRILLSNTVWIPAADSINWWITSRALPDPACIWQVGIVVLESDYRGNWVRMGLLDTLPASAAQMDNAVDIFPDLGYKLYAPPVIYCPVFVGQLFNINCRKGLVTGGKKFVVEGKVYGPGTYLLALVYIVVSGLATNMAGWQAHKKV